MDQREPSAHPLLQSYCGHAIEDTGHQSLQEPSISTISADSDKKEFPGSQPQPRLYFFFVTGSLQRLGRSPRAFWRQTTCLVRRIWNKRWTSEVCSYIVSLLAFAGLVATLMAHEAKPLPQWPQLVSINSIVSFFSLLMRASIGVVLAEGISQSKWQWFHRARPLKDMERFDSASRGSWGSISLLCHLNPKQAYYIAALGAVATVMASLTGFFSQQLIQFQDCRQLDTSATVGIARTNWFSLAGLQVQNMQPDIYPPMLAAINVGIIQPADDLTRVLSRGCISGNCTFPGNDGASFQTIGLDYRCEDATAQLHPMGNSTYESIRTHCMPNNGDYYIGLDAEPRLGHCFNSSQSEVIKTVTDVQSDFVGIHVLFRPHVQLRNYTAVNCEIFPTVNTYAAKVSNSVLEERLIDSIRIKTVSEQFKDPTVSKKKHADSSVSEQAFWYRHRMTTNYTLRDGARESCEGSEKNQTGLVRFFKSIDQSATSDPKTNASVGTNWKWWYYPQDCVWTVHSFTTISIQNAFKEIFDDKIVNQAPRGGLVGPVHLRQLWNGGNMTLESVNDLMSNLTTSMMAVIRTHAQEQDKGPTWITGDMWINTTCMYIRWPWITFPAVMIGLTGVFLLLVAIQNRGVESERLWKSSVLATLFCAVEYGNKDAPRLESRQAMEDIAKSTSVSLEGKTGSLKLVAR